MIDTPVQPGATYKFIVRTAEEAVQTIRERLGGNAKVLSVRQIASPGISGLLGRPKLEVIAQTGLNEPPSLEEAPEAPEAPGQSEREGTEADALRPQLRDAPARIPDLLRRSGFSETIVGRLQAEPTFSHSRLRPLHEALADVGQNLRKKAAARPRKLLPDRTAFLGSAGVGRTTALCKWLGREIFAQQRTGRVIKAEFDKPNPADGLAVFCEALGITLENHSPASNEETPANGPLTVLPGQFLYADLPGLSLRQSADNEKLRRFLDEEKFNGRVLVLNAVYDLPVLRRTYALGREMGATHLVFTHLDELEQWGKLWDFLLEGELTPLFFATGPSLSGDCDENVAETLIRRTLPGA